jgi:hypothetical protein
MKFRFCELYLIRAASRRSYLLAILSILATSISARAETQPLESPEALGFMRNAEAVYVFPLKNPSEPRRDDKH